MTLSLCMYLRDVGRLSFDLANVNASSCVVVCE